MQDYIIYSLGVLYYYFVPLYLSKSLLNKAISFGTCLLSNQPFMGNKISLQTKCDLMQIITSHSLLAVVVLHVTHNITFHFVDKPVLFS